ncbi:MAG TPA: gephyrin-like molybdotransferase Glp [Burkholderiaceae bacterium]|nr:gephyrin-like molybdotransferase Glp [Burkholderiaceae bacterium]
MLDVRTALNLLLDAARPVLEHEIVPTIEAADRVLAHDVLSRVNVPPMRAAQMDGYAVRTSEVANASDAAPVRLRVAQRIPAGTVGTALEPGTAARIFTGAPLPVNADAVVMQEQTRADGDDVWIQHAPRSGEWIRPIGEDIAEDDVVLNTGEPLTPQALGLAASVGCATLAVRRRVRVAAFFTGNELAMPGEALKPGAIYNSNRFVLRALLTRLGCEVHDFGIVRDDRGATIEALKAAARDCDLVVTSGGMSVGEEDHVKPAVEAVGKLSLWQIAIKPGKPLAFGEIERDARAPAFFIGLPGNPVSAFVTFLLFVRPFVLKLQGHTQIEPRRYTMRADFDWPRPDKRQEYLRVRINAQGGLDVFESQSSSVLTSTVWGDGLVENLPGQTIARGQLVTFIPFKELS